MQCISLTQAWMEIVSEVFVLPIVFVAVMGFIHYRIRKGQE
jgi:hypothetical protein